MTAANGVNRRKVQNVKAHVVNHRQALVHIIEGTVAGRVIGDRTREQLVPAGKLRQLTLNLYRVLGAKAQISVVLCLGHQLRTMFVHKQRHLLSLQQT